MTVRVLTFFSNKGGVGKTSLVYHVAWMLADLDHRVLVADLDPQANLTAAFLDENELAALWDRADTDEADTVFRCVSPLMKTGDLRPPRLRSVTPRLSLLPGDLALSSFEDNLSTEWPGCMGGIHSLYRPFRVTSALWQVLRAGASQVAADIILVDVGPSLGAINRAALIATDCLVVPLAADLFSLQGLKNLGPTLRTWRQDWQRRLGNWPSPDFELPSGAMRPIGYVVQQHGVRLNRPVAAYDRWVRRIPAEYERSVLGRSGTPAELDPEHDPSRIATLKHYRSLIPLAQDARKPIFRLTAAEGAIGSHAVAARDAYGDFASLTTEILRRMES